MTRGATPVIDVVGVGKRFRRPSNQRGTGSLRSLGELRGRTDHWALRDVTMSIDHGESVGIIGRNGAGKSTLLRLLSGITAPTTGSITLHSPVSGLLTLGDSFQTILTGEENALTAAILAGLTRAQAKSRLDDITRFAELDDVIDQPLRTYSDGMKLRLAFAVSVHVDPEVLLIDEVLAVGDVRFRQKCLAELTRLRDDRSLTLVLTSHDLDQVRTLCSRAVWLSDGRVECDGSPDDVAARYVESFATEVGETVVSETGQVRQGTGEIRILRVGLNADESGHGTIVAGDPLAISVDLIAHEPVDEAVFVVTAYDEHGATCFDLATEYDGLTVGPLDDEHGVRLLLHRLDLAPGSYRLDVGVYTPSFARAIDLLIDSVHFEVAGPKATGMIVPPHQWTLT